MDNCGQKISALKYRQDPQSQIYNSAVPVHVHGPNISSHPLGARTATVSPVSVTMEPWWSWLLILVNSWTFKGGKIHVPYWI